MTYTYDGDGKRVKKSNGTLYWTGPGWDPLVETDLSGNVTEEYVFFNGERVARVDMPANTVEYYFSDHLKSTDIVTNATRGIVHESDYVPYGGEVVISGTDPNRYKFTGKERDSESDLDNFGARYYASTTGRFMTPDWALKPISVPYAKFGDPQTLNLYTYVENSPLDRIDADGHEESGAGPETMATPDRAAGVSGNNVDLEHAQDQQALTNDQQAQNTSFNVTPGLQYVTITTSSQTSTTDDKGVTTTTKTTSTAYFSAQGDNAGKYVGTATRTETVRSDDPSHPSSKTTVSQQDAKGLNATFGAKWVIFAQQGAGEYASHGPTSIGFFKPSKHDLVQGGAMVGGGICLLTPCSAAVTAGAFVVGAVDYAAEKLHWW